MGTTVPNFNNLPVDIVEIKGDIKVIRTEWQYIKKDVETKHEQNRKDIHELKNIVQTLIDSITSINLKLARMAGYAVGAGAVVAVVVKIIEKVWK